MARSDNRIAPSQARDFADYAQEFLRRNGQYQREFAQLAGMRDDAAKTTAAFRMAHRWGLEFPHRSRRRTNDFPCDLAVRRLRACGNPYRLHQ